MATFLDLGLLQYFDFIFPILLIFAVVFALLHKTKILGENPSLNAVIAFALALMSLLSPDLIDLINFMSPWFVLVFVFLILLLLVYQTLGATEKDIFSALKGEKTIQWAVFGIAILILIAGVAHVFGQRMLPLTQTPTETVITEGSTTTPAYEQNVFATLFNTKILGLIFIFLIAVFAIAFLSGSNK